MLGGVVQSLFQVVQQIIKLGTEGMILLLIPSVPNVHEQAVIRLPVGHDLLLFQDVQAHQV